MKETSEQVMQYLERGIAWMLGLIQLVWTWSRDQILKLMETRWENWPLWRQILLTIVLALVALVLFIAARQLWDAVLTLLYAVANFVSALIRTLPTILIAGAITLGGLWVLNNIQDQSFLHNRSR